MKILLIICLASLMLISLGNAQITVPQSTLQNLFTVGNPLYIYVDTSSTRTSVNVGGRGGPQTYDFSALTFALFKKDTVRLVSSFPYLASRFPGAALALSFTNTPDEKNHPLLMFENNSITFPGEYEGFTADSFGVSHSNPHELFVKFPVTYGDSTRETPTLSDSIFSQGVLSTSGSNVIPIDHVVDGYGTLILPGGESHPCLRFRMEEQPPYNYMGIRYVTDNGILLMVESNNSQPETGTIAIDGITMFRSSPITSVPYGAMQIPGPFMLNQNFPNPFNPVTTISFRLESAERVILTVHNILGETVAKLIDGEMEPGLHSVEWSASGYPSGTYFYTLHSGSSVQTRKLLLIR